MSCQPTVSPDSGDRRHSRLGRVNQGHTPFSTIDLLCYGLKNEGMRRRALRFGNVVDAELEFIGHTDGGARHKLFLSKPITVVAQVYHMAAFSPILPTLALGRKSRSHHVRQ